MYSAPSSSSASPSDTVRGEWRRTWLTKRKTLRDFNFWGVQNVVFIYKRVPVVIHTACVYSCDFFFFELLKPYNSKFIGVFKKPYEPKIVDIAKLIYISLNNGSYVGYLMILDTLLKYSLEQVYGLLTRFNISMILIYLCFKH